MGRGEGSSQSGSDERGSTRSGDQRKSSSRDPDTLVVRLSEKVNHDGALSISDHLRAVRLLCQLRDHLTTTHTPFSATSRVRLLCCGVSLHRRFAVGVVEGHHRSTFLRESEPRPALCMASTDSIGHRGPQ